MFEACSSCGSELAYRDNPNPLLNTVQQCENSRCKSPHRVEYYEAPADVSLFRATEAWQECLIDAANEEAGCVHNENLLKRADALYLKRVNA